jgi:diguanylate cyclase (GGDEF)-like protein/PAS domain S-box-containing protein
MLEFVVTLLVLSGTLIIVLSVAAFQRQSSPLALSFVATMLCAGIWDFGFAAEIISPTLEGKIFWANVQFLGITYLPIGWLAMTMYSTAQPRQNLRALPALAALSTITNLIVWTDSYHHIFRLNPMLNAVGVPFPLLVNHYGAYFYAVHVPFGYLLFAASLYLLLHSWQQTPAIYRRQRIALILSMLLPMLVDLLYVFGVTPIPAFNFTSIVFSLSGLLLSVNVLYLRFLDVVPLAYETAINEMNVGVIVLDAPGRVSHINPAAEQITGVANDQAVGVEARQIIHRLEPLWNSSNGHAEIVILRGDAEHTYQLQRTAIMRGMKGRKSLVGQVITLNDITERAQLHRQVEQMSNTDPLTGALNRRAMTLYGEREIQSACRSQRNLSLILLDVDSFKQINDRFGHQSGDDVLKAMVQSIREQTRANDLIFRYGGDEFVVVLHETEKSEALKTAERIRDGLARLSVGAEHGAPMAVQVSLGVTNLSPDDSLEAMLHRADQALYQAKSAGKNQAVLI